MLASLFSRDSITKICIGIAAASASYFLYTPVMQRLAVNFNKQYYSYLKTKNPQRIILIRHGESEANINPELYLTIPDHKISLTTKGKDQARIAGNTIKAIVKNESVKFYVSPYLRSRQTFDNLKAMLKENEIAEVIDPFLREQEFGNFHQLIPETFEEMKLVGKFYYRFLNGESGADVFSRSALFLDTLFREIKKPDYKPYDNIIIVCHGLFMRLFLVYFMKMSIEEFNILANPHHCEYWILQKDNNNNYNLQAELEEDPDSPF